VRLNLKAQLALQVGLGVASVLLMLLLLRAYIVQEEIDRSSRNRLAVGQVLSSYVDAQLTDQLSQLARTASRLGQGPSNAVSPALEDLRSRLDPLTVYGVFLLDPEGRVVAADPPEVANAGGALLRRPEVAESLSQNRAAVSGVHAGPGGRAQFGVAVPARLAGSPPQVGVLGALVDPTNPRFTELVEASVSLGGRSSAEVVDQFGVVVAASMRERTLSSGAFPELYAQQRAAGRAGTALAFPTDGPEIDARYLVAYTPLKHAPWGLALNAPEAEVLAPIRRWDPPLVALGAATLILLVGLAVLTARSVVGPVHTLIAAARRIARGDLESAVPRAGGAELLELATALDEMRQDLLKAERARVEIDHMKDEFISSVSHELRTPLGYVKGYTTTLMREDTDWDSRTARECLEIIDESSDQLLELVDHLLDMSRINEGKLSVVPESLALAPLVREVAERAGVRSAAHKVVARVRAGLPTVLADPSRVRQVLNNLLDNAIKYSPAGGVITMTAEQVGPDVVVSVRDEGLGIPEDQLEAVFDRFNRGRHPDVRRIRGVGLGLPICRGIVEAHGGRIWAERGRTRGSIVRFTLPLELSVDHAEPAEPVETAAAETAA
jgi:signal transduction histidine kinase